MTHNKKKRLLVLTSRFPYPVLGGDRLRIYQVCKELSNRFSLTLLSICENNTEMKMPIPTDNVFDRVERVLLPRSKSYFNTLLALVGSTPMQVAYYHSVAFARAVRYHLPQHDAVLSHLIRTAEYVKGSEKPCIIEMTDAISLNYERVRQLKNLKGLKVQIYRLEAKRLLTYERQIIKDFDLSVLVSKKDRDFLVGAEHDKVIVCSNGVAIDHLPFKNRLKSKPVIIYIGNMTTIQNIDACMYFAREVMPLVNKKFKAYFRVVGRISDSDAAKLRAMENIEVTGTVEDIANTVEDARLGVCPVRLAAGVQNKVLEYMALGLPVITSSIGLEGLAALPERDLLVADTPQKYAECIFRLWDNDLLKKQLADNGYAYVKANHKWEKNLAPMLDRIEDIIKNKKNDVK